MITNFKIKSIKSINSRKAIENEAWTNTRPPNSQNRYKRIF